MSGSRTISPFFALVITTTSFSSAPHRAEVLIINLHQGVLVQNNSGGTSTNSHNGLLLPTVSLVSSLSQSLISQCSLSGFLPGLDACLLQLPGFLNLLHPEFYFCSIHQIFSNSFMTILGLSSIFQSPPTGLACGRRPVDSPWKWPWNVAVSVKSSLMPEVSAGIPCGSYATCLHSQSVWPLV